MAGQRVILRASRPRVTITIGGAGGSTLGADLTAIEALTGTGVAVRTADDTWSLDAGLASLRGVDTGADLVPYTDGANSWAATSLSAYARTLLDDASASAARTTLGIDRVYLDELLLTGDVSESAGSDTAVAALQFTPAAGGIYYVEVYGCYTAAATTTGLHWRIDPGNAIGGARFEYGRGTGATNVIVYIGPISSTNTQGLGTGIADTPFWGWAIIEADASAPTAVQVYFRTETASSAVTLKANKCLMRHRRIS
jgi:hypothetical protein